jgi:hypothetical protein
MCYIICFTLLFFDPAGALSSQHTDFGPQQQQQAAAAALAALSDVQSSRHNPSAASSRGDPAAAAAAAAAGGSGAAVPARMLQAMPSRAQVAVGDKRQLTITSYTSQPSKKKAGPVQPASRRSSSSSSSSKPWHHYTDANDPFKEFSNAQHPLVSLVAVQRALCCAK